MKKDISFSKRYVSISLIFALIAPIALVFDGDKLYHLLSLYIPMVIIGLILGKICYIEDSDDIKMFLKSLPYKKSSLIASKFLELIVLDIISISYVIIVQIILKMDYSIEQIMKMNIITGSFFLIYYSIYLLLYFKKDYNTAQNTIYIMLSLVFILMFFSNRFSSDFISKQYIFNSGIDAIIILISAVIYFASMCASIKIKR